MNNHMSNHRIVIAALLAAASLAAPVAATAQPNDPPYLVPGNESYYLQHPWERYGGPYDGRWYRERAQDDMRQNIPGIGPDLSYRIGQVLPNQWRFRQNAVNNWQRFRLVPPPPGYQWYQVGADFALVEMSTGRIAQVARGR